LTSVRPTRPWRDLTPEALRRVPGAVGVFELADGYGAVQRIGYAGGRSVFGLRGELEPFVGRYPRFRFESTTAYLTRWQELLMVHRHDHGALPPDQPDLPLRLGRLNPGGTTWTSG
jgi:hypothetical protein